MIAEVVGGEGWASLFVIDDLRFISYPGTLNLIAHETARFDRPPAGRLAPWPGGPRPYRYGALGGIEVAVLLGDAIEVGWQIEVVAPVHLRSALGLADGDLVDIDIDGMVA